MDPQFRTHRRATSCRRTTGIPSFQAFIGGIPVTVTYAGLSPNYVGLSQFDIEVPKVAAGDSVPFTFTLGGTAGSQNLVIAIGG